MRGDLKDTDVFPIKITHDWNLNWSTGKAQPVHPWPMTPDEAGFWFTGNPIIAGVQSGSVMFESLSDIAPKVNSWMCANALAETFDYVAECNVWACAISALIIVVAPAKFRVRLRPLMPCSRFQVQI